MFHRQLHRVACTPKAWAEGRLLLVLVVILRSTAVAATPHQGEVSFTKDIAPLLTQRCVSCHQPSKKRGGYQLHTFDALMTPGSSKQAPVLAGKPAESALLRRLRTSDPEERMPQKDEALSSAQIALVEKWILAGARFDGDRRDALLTESALPLKQGKPPSHYPKSFPLLAVMASGTSNECVVSGYHELIILDRGLRRVVQRIPAPSQRTFALQPLLTTNPPLWVLAGGTPGRSGELALFSPTQGNHPPTVLLRTTDTLLACAIGPDGRWIASAGADPTIRLIEMPSRTVSQSIEGHADWVTALAFTANSLELLTASRDKTSRCFKIPGGESVSAYLESAEPLLSVRSINKGKHALTAGRDRNLHVWNLEDGKRVATLPTNDREALSLIADKSLTWVLCTGGVVLEVSVESPRKVIREYASGGARLTSLALDGGSHQLLAGSHDGDLHWWTLDQPESHQHWHCLP